MAIKGLRPSIEYNENRQVKYFYFVCRKRGSYPEVLQAVWMRAFIMDKIAMNLIKKRWIVVILRRHIESLNISITIDLKRIEFHFYPPSNRI
jgi:hypothetical protein